MHLSLKTANPVQVEAQNRSQQESMQRFHKGLPSEVIVRGVHEEAHWVDIRPCTVTVTMTI